jgi:predicted AAA+ superfamily ATPase
MYTRIIHDDLITKCFSGKVIILYGPRQVGKTTLVKEIQNAFPDKTSLYLSGDDKETQEILQPSLRLLSQMVHPYELIIIDEAQRISDI